MVRIALRIVKAANALAKGARLIAAAVRTIRLPSVKIRCRQDFNAAAVASRARMGEAAGLKRSAAYVRAAAVGSIKIAPGPSEPGSPPHSRAGQLKRAIRYSVDPHSLFAYIGPVASEVGGGSIAHEYGTDWMGRKYPRRSFMGPSLERCSPYIAAAFGASVRR